MRQSWDSRWIEEAVSGNLYAYDDFGNLLLETQQHDALLNTSTSPTIDYLWTFSPAGGDNYNRLTSMTYPKRKSDGSRRTIALSYGAAAGDVDDLMSRVTKIKDNSSQAQAEFAYAGTGRRIALALGAAALQTFAFRGVPGWRLDLTTRPQSAPADSNESASCCVLFVAEGRSPQVDRPRQLRE